MATLSLNAQLVPEKRKIDANRSVAPVKIKILEYRGMSCPISHT